MKNNKVNKKEKHYGWQKPVKTTKNVNNDYYTNQFFCAMFLQHLNNIEKIKEEINLN